MVAHMASYHAPVRHLDRALGGAGRAPISASRQVVPVNKWTDGDEPIARRLLRPRRRERHRHQRQAGGSCGSSTVSTAGDHMRLAPTSSAGAPFWISPDCDAIYIGGGSWLAGAGGGAARSRVQASLYLCNQAAVIRNTLKMRCSALWTPLAGTQPRAGNALRWNGKRSCHESDFLIGMDRRALSRHSAQAARSVPCRDALSSTALRCRRPPATIICNPLKPQLTLADAETQCDQARHRIVRPRQHRRRGSDLRAQGAQIRHHRPDRACTGIQAACQRARLRLQSAALSLG